ncbi:MAG: SIR2 family protein [Deltaproteobacteria bacterium]|nr:SIR2 family protein [Deltaproteobacteria bacterium]
MQHDSKRQVELIKQVLRQGKKPIGFLLGAGCPVAIKVGPKGKLKSLIPEISDLTNQIRGEFKKTDLFQPIELVFSQLADDGKKNANIEDVLTKVRSLKQVCGKETVRGFKPKVLDQIEEKVSLEIVKVVDKILPDNNTPYHKIASWAGSIKRQFPIQVFSPNYDLLLEQALDEIAVPYFDGFVGSRIAFFDSSSMEVDELPSRWVRLWKLHGSINWRLSEDGVVCRAFPIDKDQIPLIHPSHLKYEESRRMPYLAMIDRLRAFNKMSSAVLIICGYSFRDDHINEAIIESLKGNPTCQVFALLYGDLEKYQEAIKLASSRGNLTLLASESAVIGTKREKWAPSQSGVLTPFDLGDFAKLGALIEQLIGDRTDLGERQNA